MSNINLLKFHISKKNSIIQKYLDLINQKIVVNPIIFCDKCDIQINSIPIFHSFYLSNNLHKKLILIEYNDYKVAKKIYYQNADFVVLCKDQSQQKLIDHGDLSFVKNEEIYDRLQSIIR